MKVLLKHRPVKNNQHETTIDYQRRKLGYDLRDVSVTISNEHVNLPLPMIRGKAIFEAYCQGIELFFLDLSNADCRFLPMPGISLVGCDISASDFRGADLSQADMRMVVINMSTNFDQCFARHALTKAADIGNMHDPVKVYIRTHAVFGTRSLY